MNTLDKWNGNFYFVLVDILLYIIQQIRQQIANDLLMIKYFTFQESSEYLLFPAKLILPTGVLYLKIHNTQHCTLYYIEIYVYIVLILFFYKYYRMILNDIVMTIIFNRYIILAE